MFKTSRTRLIAVLASVLVLFGAAVSVSGAQATPVPAKQKTPYSRAQAEKILAQVQHAMAPKKLAPRKVGNPLPRRDLGLLLHRLRVAKPALSKSDQAAATIADTRPIPDSPTCAAASQPVLLGSIDWEVRESAHFCVHYQTTGAGAATPYWVHATLQTLEHVYAYEVGHLGYRAPLLDQDGKYDVFLDDIGQQGYYGFCTTDNAASTSTAWCELDNDFNTNQFGAPPGNSLRVTAAHEFFHAIQFAYDANEAYWFMEGTAVWMEDQVYSTINDYLQYLQYSQITQSEIPIDTAGTFERYGAVIFWKYLTEGYHNVDLVHQVWTAASVEKGSRTGTQATIAVLKAHHVNFAQAFARFSLWNTLPPGSYGDRKLFPKPVAWGTAKMTTKSRSTGSQTISLDHLSSANVVLIPSAALPTKTRLQISVDAPNDIVAQVRVQERKLNGSVVYTTFTLSPAGNGTHTIYFSGQHTASVRVTLANVTTTADNQDFKFNAQVLLP